VKSFPIPAALPLAAALMLLLSGCGDDRPDSGAPPSSEAPASAPAPVESASAPPAPDPLLSGDQAIPTNDPLLPHESQSPTDPLASTDPLQGHAMPTEHSHWLNTEANEARVSVLLNGMRLSSFQPSGTQDITMKLHPGPNTLTVIYTPQNVHSWGSVTLTEGEHEGQAILLAEFRKAPLNDSVIFDNPTDVKPTTQTFTFFAK
jgi:hypothetical protein